jgi:predicted transcriptional regulator YdeE
MAEQKQSAINIEELWTTRTEEYGRRQFVGVRNRLPQSYEDEQRLFATLQIRKEEIADRSTDGNMYMIIHDNGSNMTVAFRVDRIADLPQDMVSLELPEEEYVVFRFEEKHICSFWEYFCDVNHQQKYGVDVVKARYETFNEVLQPNGMTEIYFPKVQQEK